MDWFQKTIVISSKKRGFLLVTDEIINQISEISNFEVGTLHLFLQHTSASLTINENADPTVREDLETHFNHSVPENVSYYKHTMEGPDDMPAHIKSTTIGNTLIIPISNGKSGSTTQPISTGAIVAAASVIVPKSSVSPTAVDNVSAPG